MKRKKARQTAFDLRRQQIVAAWESRELRVALENWPTVTAAADYLGIDRSNFHRLLRRHGIESGKKKGTNQYDGIESDPFLDIEDDSAGPAIDE